MNWLEITIKTLPSGIEDVADALTVGGFSDLVLEDQQEFEEFLDENRQYWDYIDEGLQKKLQGLSCIKLYLEDGDQESMEKLRTLLETLRGQDPKMGPLSMEVRALAPTNWEESWKENYPPQNVGQHLVVVPYWLQEQEFPGRKKVILDPGLTFGTGAHPSTQMVMETMEENVKAGDVCLDLGSGSGILSITALRLGASRAIGVDIDNKAEGIARENAAYNGFASPQFTALTGNVTEDKKLMESLTGTHYHLVLVNIVADVIISLAPVLPRFLAQDTLLICSGILDTRLQDVLQALEKAGLDVVQTKAKEDWRCVTVRRRNL